MARSQDEKKKNTQDLTALFLNFRKECYRPPPPENEDPVLPVQREEPIWVQIKNESEDKMKRIKIEMLDLSDLMERPPNLLETNDTKIEIDQRCTILMRDFDNCFQMVRELDKHGEHSDEQRSICIHIRENLCGKLSIMISDFKQMQNRYAKVVEGPVVEGQEIEDEDEWMKMIPYDPELDRLKFEEELARLRGIEYQKIYKSIREIKELFTQLSELIIEQGTIMDRIEMHLINANEYIEQGGREIKETIPKSKTGLTLWVVLLVIVIIISVIVIVMIKIRRG